MPYDITERPQADRIKAFEMYLSASTSGKSRSLRSIGAELGVSSMTISRWREVDKWDEKISKVLSEAATGAETTSNALKRRVRQGLLDGLSQLQHIAMNGAQDRDKIAAVKALADIAIRIEAITAAATAGQGEAVKTIEFDDSLPEEDKWQTITETSSLPVENEERLAKKPESAESKISEKLELPLPPSLSNSVADLALPPVEEAEAILEALEQKAS